MESLDQALKEDKEIKALSDDIWRTIWGNNESAQTSWQTLVTLIRDTPNYPKKDHNSSAADNSVVIFST